MVALPQLGRSDLVRRAFRLEWLTAAWLAIEASVAIASGIAAQSLSLIAFGADSIIEFASAGVLLWRLNVEIREGKDVPETVEHRASKIAGALLWALAIYIVASAAYGLWRHRGQEFSAPGLVLVVVTIPVMIVLAKGKIRVAERIGSRALRADAIESITCAYLATVVVGGLSVQWLMPDWWWIDSVTSLAIVGFLAKEGLEAWRDECCD